MNHWIKIAKNEIRLATYRFRNYRALFFIVAYLLSFIWALFIGPYVFDIILPEYLKTFGINFHFFFIEIIDYFLIMIFLFSLRVPLYFLYKKQDIGYIDIILASPAKPKDIFFGEFIFKLPFYFLGVLLAGPFIASAFMQFMELNVLHFFIIYIIVFCLAIFGNITGELIANLLERKIIKSIKLQNFRTQLFYIITFLIVVLFYEVRLFYLFILDNPELKSLLLFFPSFWYSNILLFSISPSFTNLNLLLLVINISLAIVVPLLIFYLTLKKAKPLYVLDSWKYPKTSTIKNINKFEKFIKKISPKKWEVLISIQFKEFFRKKENFNKIVFLLVFLTIMGFLINLPTDFPTELFSSFSDKTLLILILAWMSGFFTGIILTLNVFTNSKDLIFLYKRTPRNIRTLIFSYLLMFSYLILTLSIILSIIYYFLFQFNLLNIVFFFAIFYLYSQITVFQVIGIHCIKPIFENRQRTAFLHIYLIFCIKWISFFITFCALIPTFPSSIDAFQMLMHIIFTELFIEIGLTILVFLLGLKKFEKIE